MSVMAVHWPASPVRTIPAMCPTTSSIPDHLFRAISHTYTDMPVLSSLTHGHAKAVLLRQASPSPEHSDVHDGLLPLVPSARMMSLFCET
uniref:Uncharacterized protein n=1 Tax=Triticum urartu TaxID=4572 RepID=A0A8R7PEK5_TRIUA